jgi:transposase-like protein
LLSHFLILIYGDNLGATEPLKESVRIQGSLSLTSMLADRRDAAAAKRFFRSALQNEGNLMPRVITVDKNPLIRVRWRI